MEDYPKLLVISNWEKVQASKPAIFQWWQRATQQKQKEIRLSWIKSEASLLNTTPPFKPKTKKPLNTVTWFTEPKPPLKFWGDISAIYTGTYKVMNKRLDWIAFEILFTQISKLEQPIKSQMYRVRDYSHTKSFQQPSHVQEWIILSKTTRMRNKREVHRDFLWTPKMGI